MCKQTIGREASDRSAPTTIDVINCVQQTSSLIQKQKKVAHLSCRQYARACNYKMAAISKEIIKTHIAEKVIRLSVEIRFRVDSYLVLFPL